MSGALAHVEILLTANTARFVEQWDTARQQATTSADSIKDKALAMGKAITAGAGIAATAIGALVTKQVELANEVSRIAAISPATTQQIQYWAVSAQRAGIEQEKLGDIFKDTSDKIGEFLSSGGGEMKDFFEKVAPKIGVTAQQFRGLSGPDALQLYYNTLEKANLSQQEMTFYMEAVADEATGLIPVLKNGGVELHRFGDAAKQAGAIMSEDMITNAKKLTDEVLLMELQWTGFKNQIVSAVLPALVGLATEMNKSDGAIQGISQTVVGAVSSVTNWLQNGGVQQIEGLFGVVAVGAMAKFGGSVLATVPSLYAQATALMTNVSATIANATSQQALDTAILSAQRTRVIATLAIRNYQIAMTEAVTATVAYVRALPAKIAGLRASTSAMIANTQATLTMANAQRVAMSGANLASRGMVGVGSALSSVAGVIKAHPFMLLATVLTAIVVKTEGLQGAMASLGDAVGVVGVIFEDIVSTAVDGWGMLLDVTTGFFGSLVSDSGSSTSTATGYFADMFKGTRGGFVGLMQVGAKIFDSLATYTVTFAKVAVQNLSNAWIAIKNGFKAVGNTIISIFESVGNVGVQFVNNQIKYINLLIKGVNAVSSLFGGQKFGELGEVGKLQLGRLAYQDYAVNPSFDTQLTQNKITIASDYMDSVIARSDKAKKATEQGTQAVNQQADANKKLAQTATQAGEAGAKAGDKVKQSADDATKALQDAQKELQTLVDGYADESEKAVIQADKNSRSLAQARNFGLITDDEYKAHLAKEQAFLNEKLVDIKNQHEDEFAQYQTFYKSKEDLIAEHYQRLATKAQVNTKYSDAEKLIAIESLQYQRQAELLEYQVSMLERIQELNDYQTDDDTLITNKYAVMRAKVDAEFLTTKSPYHQKILDAIDGREKYELEQHRITQQKQISDMLDFSKTDLERIKDKYAFERQEIERNKKLTFDERLTQLAIKNQQEGWDKSQLQKTTANDFNNLNAEISGTKDYQNLQTQLDQRLEIIKKAKDSEVIATEQAEIAKAQVEKNYWDASYQLQATQSANIIESVANMGKIMLGETSSSYKRLFALSQSFVMAQAGLNMYKAISDGWAQGATLPQKLAAAATAGAEMLKIITAAQQIKMQGFATGGYTGDIPTNAVAGLVHGGEYVFDANATKQLGRKNLDSLRKGEGMGNTTVNVNVTVNGDGSSSVESQQQLGKNIGDAVNAAIQKALLKERRQGGMLSGAR